MRYSLTRSREMWRTRLEYAFYDSVMAHNRAYADDPDKLIWLSEGRMMHDMVFADIDALDRGGGKTKEADDYFRSRCADVFKKRFDEVVGRKLDPEEFYSRRANLLDMQVAEADAICGFDKTGSVVSDVLMLGLMPNGKRAWTFRAQREVAMSDEQGRPIDHAFIISPFDTRFSSLSAVQDAGSSLVYIKSEDLGDMDIAELTNRLVVRTGDNFLKDELELVKPESRPRLQASHCVANYVPVVDASMARGLYRNLPGRGIPCYTDRVASQASDGTQSVRYRKLSDSLVCDEDVLGVTKLRNRMTQAEWDDVHDWIVEGYGDLRQLTNKRIQKIRNDFECASRMLDRLQDMRIPYSVRRDMKSGQACVEIAGTNITMRLTDASEESSKYIGRVYMDGAQIYLSTTERAHLTEDGRQITDADEAKRLYAAGQLKLTSKGGLQREMVAYDWEDVREQLQHDAKVRGWSAAEVSERVMRQRVDDSLCPLMSALGRAFPEASHATSGPVAAVEARRFMGAPMPAFPKSAAKGDIYDKYNEPLRRTKNMHPSIMRNGEVFTGVSPEILSVHWDMSRRSPKASRFEFLPQPDMMARVSAMVDEAHANVRRDVGLIDDDGNASWLVDLAQDYRRRADAAKEYENSLVERGIDQGSARRLAKYPDYPVFEDAKAISDLQHQYFDVLIGAKNELPMPGGVSQALFEYGLEDDGAGEFVYGEDTTVTAQLEIMKVAPEADYAERLKLCRDHMQRHLDIIIGTYEAGEDGKRFSIGQVAANCDGQNAFENTDRLVAYCRGLGFTADEMRMTAGRDDELAGDRLVYFDEASAAPIEEVSRYEHYANTIRGALQRHGCDVVPGRMLVDKNGIVHYDALRRISVNEGRSPNYASPSYETEAFSGEIGPLPYIDEDNYVVVPSATGDDWTFAPGYDAYVLPPARYAGNVYDRTRLRGFEDKIDAAICARITTDTFERSRSRVGEPMSLLATYRAAAADRDRYPQGYEEIFKDQGLDEDLWHAKRQVEADFVRYVGEQNLRQGSTTLVAIDSVRNNQENELANDNGLDAWSLTKHHNMAQVECRWASPVVTPNAQGQGTNLHLVENAEVMEDGSVWAPDPGLDGVTSVSVLEKYRRDVMWGGKDYSCFDQYNRDQMAVNNLKDCLATTVGGEPARAVMMAGGGFEQDDGFVISADFAAKHMIYGDVIDEAGNKTHGLRPLGIGDKLSDVHGNKGVIARVVGLADDDYLGELFRQNDLDVLMSPFSAISRNNAGTVRELMDSAFDIKVPIVDADGKPVGQTRQVVAGGGMLHMIIHDKTAEKKTNIYDQDMMSQGRSRKAGWQLMGALAAKDCKNIMAEIAGYNTTALADFREHLITCGMDFRTDGSLVMNTDDLPENARRVLNPEVIPVSMSADEWKALDADDPAREKLTNNGNIAINRITSQLLDSLDHAGGSLALPFPLKYPCVELTDDTGETVSYGGEELKLMSESGAYEASVGNGASNNYDALVDDAFKPVPVRDGARGIDLYELPVMSSRLRSGSEHEDGELIRHEYTYAYRDIYKSALAWYQAFDKGDEAGMAAAQATAQAKFDSINEDVMARCLSGKYNDAKKSLMSVKGLKHAATAIWSANPEQDIDTVGMSADMMTALGIKPDDHVMLWRDPVLTPNCARYLRVVEVPEITGVSVHPGIAPVIAGDFDGDTVGIKRLDTLDAQREAYEKFSLEANLLDFVNGPDENGLYDFNFECGLDARLGFSQRPDLQERLDTLRRDANAFEREVSVHIRESEKVDPNYMAEVMAGRRELCQNLGSLIHEAMTCDEAHMCLRFGSDEEVIRSMYEVCVATGAKGSMKKLAGKTSGVDTPGTFAHYFGVVCDFDDNGINGVTTNMACGEPASFRTKEDDLSCMLAMNAKTVCTGISGRYQQRGMQITDNPFVQEMVLYLTERAYQKTLDWKHDGAEALRQAPILKDALRDTWRGIKLDVRDVNGETQYKRCYTQDGKLETLTREEWVAQMNAVHKTMDMELPQTALRTVSYAMLMPDTNYVGDVEGDELRDRGSVLAKIALGGKVEDLFKAAVRKDTLFSGEIGKMYEPKSYVKNDALYEALVSDKMTVDQVLDQVKDASKTDVRDMGPMKVQVTRGGYSVGGVQQVKKASLDYSKAADIEEVTETSMGQDVSVVLNRFTDVEMNEFASERKEEELVASI